MKKIMIVAGLGSSLVRFRGELIRSWLNLGYQVVAAAPGREVEADLKALGVEYRRIPLKRTGMNPLHDLTLLYKMIGLLRKERPDYLFLYTVKPVIYGSLAAFSLRPVKVFSMITGLGYAFSGVEGKSFLRRLVVFLYSHALRRNEKVFFQNPDDEALFERERIISPDRVVRINGSGVNLEYFYPAPVKEGRMRFLLIARLLAEKGIKEFVQAAAEVKAGSPGAEFAVVGWSFEDNPSAIRKEEVDAWQKAGVVEIFGEKEDVRPFIAGCSVYVLPSYREGTPRTVLEAMAMGRAIITTDAPGCRETVTEGVNGFLVPVKDSAVLAWAMEKFIIEPGLAERMGQESRKIAEEKYDVHKVNKVINQAMGLL